MLNEVYEMNPTLDHYLQSLLPPKEDWIIAMEKQAKAERVPIMDPVSMHFLLQMVHMLQPKHILEIGTAIGYSALRMHTVAPQAKITTIERDDIRFEQASDHIQSQQKANDIQVMHGDALDILSELASGTYDLIFIDAAKGQYKHFFNLSIPLLSEKGVIISDNVLFRGFVSGETKPAKRYEKLTNKIQQYNEWVTSHPKFNTSIIPIGDGLAISHQNIT